MHIHFETPLQHSDKDNADKIRDIEGAIPQCQSRISELCYLPVISLYLSLSYLPKCAGPYLPTICSTSSLSPVGSFSFSVCFQAFQETLRVF